MNALVIGCGMVGGRVARILRDGGHRVFASTRSAAKASSLGREGLDPIIFDVLEPETFASLPEVDVCLHCLAFDRRSGADRHDVIVGGLRRTLDRLGGRVGRLVACGTTGVYGDHGGDWVDETTMPIPTTDSGLVALDAERVVAEFRERSNIPAIVLRLAGLYGPGRIIGRATVQGGEPILADPMAFLNLVHLDDAAAALVAAAEFEAPGPLYLVSDDQPLRRGDYYSELAHCLSAPPPRFGPVETNTTSRRISNRRIKDELGFAPRYPDVKDGLRALLDLDRA